MDERVRFEQRKGDLKQATEERQREDGQYVSENEGLKYGINDLEGRDKFVRGNINLWKEIPASWRVSEDTAFVYTPESDAAIGEHVVQKLRMIAEKHGIGMIFAGESFPIHTTVQAGDYKGEAGTREAAQDQIAADPEVAAHMDQLRNFPIDFKYLLLNGDNITLNAVAIPKEVVDFRDFFTEKLQGNQYFAKQMENIVHITVARITSLPDLPEAERDEKLKAFVKDLVALRHEISSNPLRLAVDHVYLGQDILNKKREEM